MTNLQRQRAFVKRLCEIENTRVLRLRLPGLTSSKLNGLMAVLGSIEKLCDLEEVSAEILLKGNGDLPLQGIGTIAKLNEIDEKLFLSRYAQAHD